MRKYLVRAVAIGAFLGAGLGAAGLVVQARHHARSAATTAAVTTARPHPKPPQRPKGPHNAPVPILMYHVLAASPAGAPYPQLYVRPADFAAQVRWLAQQGYHAVSLRRVKI